LTPFSHSLTLLSRTDKNVIYTISQFYLRDSFFLSYHCDVPTFWPSYKQAEIHERRKIELNTKLS
jgi:hypothetical protein